MMCSALDGLLYLHLDVAPSQRSQSDLVFMGGVLICFWPVLIYIMLWLCDEGSRMISLPFSGGDFADPASPMGNV